MFLGFLWIGLVVIHRIEPVPWYSDVDQADAVAEIICQHTDAIWLEGFGSGSAISPRSVGVAMVVQGNVTWWLQVAQRTRFG